MRTYAERYAADEICNEGHEKRAGEPCTECAENVLPPVLRTPVPPFAACQTSPSHDELTPTT